MIKILTLGFVSSMICERGRDILSLCRLLIMNQDNRLEVLSTPILAAIDKKLQCGICLEQVGSDAVEMVCRGKHSFCFKCIIGYIDALENHKGASCPTCRSGKGAVMASPFMAELAALTVVPTSETKCIMREFREMADGCLKERYPGIFDVAHLAIISPAAIVAFLQYKKNRRVVSHFTPSEVSSLRASQPVNTTLEQENTDYAAVSIDLRDNMFCVSLHSSEERAKEVVKNAPVSFTSSFVVRVASGMEALVTYQSKPVELLWVGIPYNDYFESTFLTHYPTIMADIGTELDHFINVSPRGGQDATDI